MAQSSRKIFIPLIAVAFLAPLSPSTGMAAPKPAFENLGKPVRLPLPIQFVTTDSQDRSIAWGSLLDDERRAMVGVRLENGELVTVDLTKYGKSNANLLFKRDENTIFIYAGNPGRFFKYEIAENKLTLPGDASQATYWMSTSGIVAPDGEIYVGTFPRTGVSALDPTSGAVEHWRVNNDPRQAYVITPAAADDGTVYFPTGLHHAELWSYNPKTKEKKQILPASLQKRTGGTASVWTGIDGQVYGQLGAQNFQCLPDSIVLGQTKLKRPNLQTAAFNGKTVREIDGDGRLVFIDQATQETSYLQTSFVSRAITLFSIGDELKGKIYGSSLKPGHVFACDTTTGKTEQLGPLTTGHVQVYDFLAYYGGLFMSSYTGSYFDYYDPSLPRSETNPHRIGRAGQQQERPLHLVLGPDGMIYSPNMPVKGQLGGALTRIDPKTSAIETWRDIVPRQSLMSVAAVPETGEVFLTSSIAGGSSAIPTEKEAVVALWNIKAEQIAFTAKPIARATAYGEAVRARTGIIYGFAKNQYYAFDPVKRQTVFTGRLPSASPGVLLADKPVGPAGLIYGVSRGDGSIFAIDPADHSLKVLTKDPSLIKTHAISVTMDGVLYYTHGASLMRCKLP
jgi:outer membrane protein assembly factor BamB